MIKEKYLYRVTTPDRRSCYVVTGIGQLDAAYRGNIKLDQMYDKEQLTVEFIDMVVTGLIGDDEEDEG